MTHKGGTHISHKNGVTKERILDEAEALFAKSGYHAVSVREITTSAECNLAAVNYHFGNKQNLYLEVFRSRWLPRAKDLYRNFRTSHQAKGNPSPTTVVQSLAQAFLEGSMTEKERLRHLQLICGELVQPTEAFELVTGQVLRPLFNNLMADMRGVMPDALDEEQLALNAFSILAMVLYFNFARYLIISVLGVNNGNDFKTRLINHIVQFSLNGIRAGEEEVRK